MTTDDRIDRIEQAVERLTEIRSDRPGSEPLYSPGGVDIGMTNDEARQVMEEQTRLMTDIRDDVREIADMMRRGEQNAGIGPAQ